MKYNLCFLAFAFFSCFITNSANAQGMAVNATGAAASASAMLDVASTSQGMLVPRMTAAQKTAISSPATGLMIFQTDGTSGFYYYTGSAWNAVSGGSSLPSGTIGDLLYYNGTSWVSLPAGTNGKYLLVEGGIPTWAPTTTLTIGSSYGGGIVAYLLQPGDAGYSALEQHGLIAATSDQSTGIVWGCFGTLLGALGFQIGTGRNNTDIVSFLCGSSGNGSAVCKSYSSGGFLGWYLPNRAELQILYVNRVAIGGFDASFYWSSSENSGNLAWRVGFAGGGGGSNASKNTTCAVRAVRSF